MQTFKLDLPGNTSISGRHNIPPRGPGHSRPKYCPVIVGLHGGCYCSAYFDVNEYSARHMSSATEVPFVAIDRPGYEQTTAVGNIPETSSFQEEWGKLLHQQLLPAIWKEFGVANDCSSIVLHCHSLGTPGACVAAALHAKETSPAYPLAGISISGFGNGTKNFRDPSSARIGDNPPEFFTIPKEAKDAIMFVPGGVDPAMLENTAILDRPMPFREIVDLYSKFLATWNERYAAGIKVPLSIGLAERDGLWFGTAKDLREYAEAFKGSKKVDANLIRGAPHNLELSYWSQGWYARVFGFAMEVATSHAVENDQATKS
ncbi:Alpha beta hydrolase fold protein [Colletotrichum asianum]